MYTDPTRAQRWQQLVQRDFRVFAHLLTPSRLVRAAQAVGLTIGRSPLHLSNLVWLALACAFHCTRSFADVLGLTLKLLQDLADGPNQPTPTPKRKGRGHDPRVHDPDQLSADAFAQARRRVPWAFWLALIGLLADDFALEHGSLLLWRGRYRLLCLDGTTLDLPNWPALTKHFGSASKGQGRRQTQARLVLLQLSNARLPWRFDLTPLAQTEQEVAGRLLADVRANDLVLMDRGFFCYRLFGQIQTQQAFFATRLRKQIKLQTLRTLGPGDRRVRWQPASSAARKAIRELDLPAALELRVIDYQIQGFRPSAVVTNLLDAQEVPAEEFVRLAVVEQGRRLVAAGLYHRRWEIETSFLELKVTQGLEGSLRSRTPESIGYEVAGHLLLYTLMRWLMVEAAVQEKQEDPLRLSYQEALEELEDLRPALLRAGSRRLRSVWRPRLLQRISSHVIPWRPQRHYRRPHDTKAKAKGGGRYQEASKLEPSPGPKATADNPTPKTRK